MSQGFHRLTLLATHLCRSHCNFYTVIMKPVKVFQVSQTNGTVNSTPLSEGAPMVDPAPMRRNHLPSSSALSPRFFPGPSRFWCERPDGGIKVKAGTIPQRCAAAGMTAQPLVTQPFPVHGHPKQKTGQGQRRRIGFKGAFDVPLFVEFLDALWMTSGLLLA